MDRMHTLALLLRAGPTSDITAFERAVVDAGRRLSADLGSGATVRCAVSAAHHLDRAATLASHLEPLERILAHGLPPIEQPVEATSYDATLVVRLPDRTDPDPLSDAAQQAVGDLGELVDGTRSALVAGTEHVVIAGAGAFEMYYGIARRADLGHEQFSDYWRNAFTQQHSLHTPGKAGYHQLHADLELTARLARATGLTGGDFDGLAIEWFPDVDAFLLADAHGRAQSGAGAAFMDGERHMNDFARARCMLGFDVDLVPEPTT
jgi:hypothetical protein